MKLTLYQHDLKEEFLTTNEHNATVPTIDPTEVRVHHFNEQAQQALRVVGEARYHPLIGPDVTIVAHFIEVYFDALQIYAGGRGCWRARMAHNHGIHDVAATKDKVVAALKITAASFGVENTQDLDVIEIKV